MHGIDGADGGCITDTDCIGADPDKSTIFFVQLTQTICKVGRILVIKPP